MAREYKDSGIAWIGEIPSHWKVVPFKSVYSLGKGLTITKADLVEKGVPVISYGQIHSKENNGTSIKDELIRFVPESYLINNQNCLVNLGDVIFADTSEDLDGCGNCVYVDRKMALFAGYHTIIATNHSEYKNKYFSYLFKTDCWRLQIRSMVNGVKLYSVPQRILSSTSVIIPPLPEQRAIADYLDRKCGEIDELISLQEKIIEELKAYKQSVITEAVTKGLNPDVPMKDSGIEWIGEIPEGWELKKLKYIVDSIYKGNGITKDEVFADGDIPCVRYGEIYSKYNHAFVECFSATKKELHKTPRYFYQGDILCAGTGELVEEIGKSIVYLGKKSCLAGGDIIVISHRQIPSFLNYSLNSNYTQAQKSKGKAKLKVVHISVSEIGNILMILPSLSEQQAIADYLDNKCSKIDSLIALKQTKIEELKEYKKSIIYECVTGKIEIV